MFELTRGSLFREQGTESSDEDIRAERLQADDSWMNPSYLHSVSMNELYETVYTSRPPVIDGLLYPGTYLFVGAPKVGKSFFMAQLAYHVSTGSALWDFPVRQGTVLCLALEDDYRRLQKRLSRMFGVEGTDELRLATCAKQLGKGLDDQLAYFLKQYPTTKLGIIDTLQKVRESGGEGYSYSSDCELVGKLKALADRYDLCLLLVHHTRKQPAGDSFEMISGTNGLLGAADGAFVLRKEKRNTKEAVLDVAGRDQQEQKLHLVRDAETLSWNLEHAENEADEEPIDPTLVAVGRYFQYKAEGWSGTATELVALLGLNIQPNKLTMKLNVGADRLQHEYGLIYRNSRTYAGRCISLSHEIIVT